MGKRKRKHKKATPSKARVRDVMAEVDALGLPDGAHWAMVHERLGMDYGDVFDILAEDPDFFGITEGPLVA